MSNFDQTPMEVKPYTSPVTPLSSPTQMEYDAEMDRRRDPREYFFILWKRKWWVIGTFLVIFILTALYTFLRTPIYRGSTQLQITQDSIGSQLTLGDRVSSYYDYDGLEKFQQTQYKILESHSLALRVVRALNLQETPAFKELRESFPERSYSELEDLMADGLLANLEIAPVKNSYLVEVSYTSPDKVMAQRVVNAIADEYMYLTINRRNESFRLVRKWLNQQLSDMATKVQAAQKKLYKFGQKTDIYTTEDKDNVIVQKFVDLSSLLTKAQAEKMAKEAQYKQVKEEGPDAPLIVNNPLVAALRQQLAAQEAKVSAMRKVYRSGHPEFQAEQANLAELRRRLRTEIKRSQDSVKADYEASVRAEKLLADSYAAQKQQMVKLQDNLTHLAILKRDAQTSEQLYQALLSRVKEASIAGTMVPNNVAVIDPALLPIKPYKPRKMRDLALASVLGLTLGVCLAFGLEYLDDSIKSLDDLERACMLPSLGVVPFQYNEDRIFGRGKRPSLPLLKSYLPWKRKESLQEEVPDLDLIVYKHPQSLISEAVGHVYSSMMLSTSGHPPCTVMVTSPSPSEGKSTLVSNLALSCALNNRPTVLIDCDLRKPRLHRAFGISPQPGLTNYLTGNSTLKEIIRMTDIPNLSIITAGASPPSPTNLLNSEIFKEMIMLLRSQFQHVFIDTPPVLGFADARFVSMLVDGVLLVTKYNSTHKSAGRLAHQLLSQAPILGTVLNHVGSYGQGYGYYYSDKYYAKYYGGRKNN